MKIRTGFVSNSSSSSFVLVGWDGKELENYDWTNDEYTYHPTEGLVGYELATMEDYEMGELDLGDLLVAFEKAKDLKVKLGFDEDAKLHFGTRSS